MKYDVTLKVITRNWMSKPIRVEARGEPDAHNAALINCTEFIPGGTITADVVPVTEDTQAKEHASLVRWFERCPFKEYSIGALAAAYKTLTEYED